MTLMEILVTMVIIVVLAGIVFAVASTSVASAKRSSDMNDLKQIAYAQALYGSDYAGDMAWDTDVISRHAKLDSRVWVSELDDAADPLVNRWARENPNHFVLTRGKAPELKTSYLPHIMLSPGSTLTPEFQDGRCAWLISLSTASCWGGTSVNCLTTREGSILKLFPDGRVKTSLIGPVERKTENGASFHWDNKEIWGCSLE